MIEAYQLGVVSSPLVGQEKYEGMVSIPYLRWHPRTGVSVVSIRYRNITGSGSKYLTSAGDKARLFNTMALLQNTPIVGIAEGEFDAIIASACGLPTVGMPGVSSFQNHWLSLFSGYKKVLVFGDGDDAGRRFTTDMVSKMPNAVGVEMPDDHDINSLYQKYGKERLKQYWSDF